MSDDTELESLRDIVVEMEQKLLLCREVLHAIKEFEVVTKEDLYKTKEMANDCLLRLSDNYRMHNAAEA